MTSECSLRPGNGFAGRGRTKDAAMLVIISDLHLTDGTIGESLPPGAFQIFAERLRELAESASWRADGSYRPVERIDLILLGDMLDAIRSAHWGTQEQVRPWSDPDSPDVVEQV